jgi:hypothetical protein
LSRGNENNFQISPSDFLGKHLVAETRIGELLKAIKPNIKGSGMRTIEKPIASRRYHKKLSHYWPKAAGQQRPDQKGRFQFNPVDPLGGAG